MPERSTPLRGRPAQTRFVAGRQQETSARRSSSPTTPVAAHVARARQETSGFGVLEQLWVQLVALEELVELGAVALGQARRLRHVAVGDAQDLREIGRASCREGV